jgi:hypothetical protein
VTEQGLQNPSPAGDAGRGRGMRGCGAQGCGVAVWGGEGSRGSAAGGAGSASGLALDGSRAAQLLLLVTLGTKNREPRTEPK